MEVMYLTEPVLPKGLALNLLDPSLLYSLEADAILDIDEHATKVANVSRCKMRLVSHGTHLHSLTKLPLLTRNPRFSFLTVEGASYSALNLSAIW